MKKIFFTGLATLLPLAVTFWVISFVVHFLTKPFMGVVTSFLTSYPAIASQVPAQAIRTISEIAILISLFLFILILGFSAKRLFINPLLRVGDRLLHKIPLVNKVYRLSQEIVQSLFSSQNGSFKQVVLLSFPYPGAYCLGLSASDAPKTCNQAAQNEMVSIFIPTTPNPTTGYIVMRKREDLVYLDMKSEAAIKYIVSCGVILPESRGEK